MSSLLLNYETLSFKVAAYFIIRFTLAFLRSGSKNLNFFSSVFVLTKYFSDVFLSCGFWLGTAR